MKVQYLINPIKTAKETVFKRMTKSPHWERKTNKQ